MKYNNWTPSTEYPINQISDIVENASHYILRSARAIYFMAKESMTISNKIALAIDHELGYKLLQANDEACFIIVHCESQNSDDIFGDPKKPHLQSYSTQGFNWSYALSGWSISANYGGVFLIEDVLVFTEKKEEQIRTVVLDAATGQVIKIIPGHRYKDHSGNHLGMLPSLKDTKNKKIYYTVNSRGLYVIDLKAQELSNTLLLPFSPKTITQNEAFIYCHGFNEGKTYFFVIDKTTNIVEQEIIVDDKINIERMIASNDNCSLLLIHQDYSVSSFDLLNNAINWNLALDRKSKIYQAAIDSNNFAYLFWKKPSTLISVINIDSGETIQNITPPEGKFYPPFFLLKDALFVADFKKLYCFTSKRS